MEVIKLTVLNFLGFGAYLEDVVEKASAFGVGSITLNFCLGS